MKFTSKLNSWYSKNKRPLPWRKNKEPYRVWLSEIILQQTRIDQGKPYFERFVQAYPDVIALANASEDDILKLWQGLGYYSRARNLHKAAKQVATDFQGKFPNNYKALLQLKGVGPYSAAAIASICFDEPVPVVDGNVFRFLGRFFGIEEPIDSARGKNAFFNQASGLIDKNHPGDFNQAMMEFGATVCTPRNPLCATCPFREDCKAFNTDRVSHFPVKSRKTKVTRLHIHYFVVPSAKGFVLQQRPSRGIWANLYEFPSIASEKPLSENELSEKVLQLGLPDLSMAQKTESVEHLLSHRKITAYFWRYADAYTLSENFETVSEDAISQFAVPKLLENYINSHILKDNE
jgi:A/G-specific adenine glycosylase